MTIPGFYSKKLALGEIRTLNPLRASHFKCDSYTSSDTRANCYLIVLNRSFLLHTYFLPGKAF